MREKENKPTTFTPQQAKAKAQHYCAYQERSQQEVRDKLYAWGLHREDVENMIAELIEDGFLNEDRFAKAYALGKFRMKGWGKQKITQGLRAKNVSDRLIKEALLLIEDENYLKEGIKIAYKKIKTLKNEDSNSKRQKIYKFLLSKGYENDIIIKILKKIS